MLGCGFRKVKHYWFVQWQGDSFRRVAVGFRTVSGRDEGWIEVTVGIGFRSLDTLLSKCRLDMELFNPDSPCAIATLTERLRGGPPYQTVQWRILPDVNANAVGPEVVNEVKEWALPFLDQHSSLEYTMAAWEAGQYYVTRFQRDVYLAAAYWLRGEEERAVKVIKEGIQYREQPLRERAARRGLPYEQERRYDPDIVRYEKLVNFFVSLQRPEVDSH
jgi:hypothetical protein